MKKQLNLSTALATVAFSAMAFATPVALAQDAAQPETTQEQMEAPADGAVTMEKAPEAEVGTDTMTEPAMESEEAMPATDMDAAPTADMAATSTEKFFVYEAANQMTSDDLIGSDIKNTAGESLGDVEQIIVSTEGDLAGVIVGVGGFLGIGEKSVAINFDAITFETDPDSGDTLLVLNSTKEELEAAPEFTTKEEQASEEEAMTTAEPMAETPVAPETMEAPKEEVPAQ
ncbi:PRC-barrel domain-containing protein [Ahrensia sp. 13_GOM-1096m]|uniref:PRC-barrel domain-containing protein n=1 Tax=Ahrensia sp. 13_GOM-1096m TaxID=1380380 RepID=UPI00047DC6D9|nr:PRC-barrel domain-containing protein [Ahrensia sp. 13_GOM-1096m]